jgi:hypothetical protein
VQNIKFHDKNTQHITNVRLYYTNTPTFNTSTLIGTAASLNNIINYDVIPQRSIPHGKHYFWVVCDIAATAPSGIILDAKFESITLSNGQTITYHQVPISDPDGFIRVTNDTYVTIGTAASITSSLPQ